MSVLPQSSLDSLTVIVHFEENQETYVTWAISLALIDVSLAKFWPVADGKSTTGL